jgi:putative acetyltransferase
VLETLPVVEIRHARPEDALAVQRVYVAAVKDVSNDHYSHEELDAWSQNMDPSTFAARFDDHDMFVAVADDVVVGFGDFYPTTGLMAAIYVDPAFAGRHVGTELLMRAEHAARARGIAELYLDASLNAVPFYVARGYSIGATARHRLRTGTELTCVTMKKSLVD